jgi:hypothetical protein
MLLRKSWKEEQATSVGRLSWRKGLKSHFLKKVHRAVWRKGRRLRADGVLSIPLHSRLCMPGYRCERDVRKSLVPYQHTGQDRLR